MKNNGGTKMSCPDCKSEQVCQRFGLDEIGEDKEQRVKYNDHSDLHYFRRGRECLTCKRIFQTAEISEDRLFGLIKLRDILIGVK